MTQGVRRGCPYGSKTKTAAPGAVKCPMSKSQYLAELSAAEIYWVFNAGASMVIEAWALDIKLSGAFLFYFHCILEVMVVDISVWRMCAQNTYSHCS